MFVNGVGIPTATASAMTAAAVGAITTPGARLIIGMPSLPTMGTTKLVSALSAL